MTQEQMGKFMACVAKARFAEPSSEGAPDEATRKRHALRHELIIEACRAIVDPHGTVVQPTLPVASVTW